MLAVILNILPRDISAFFGIESTLELTVPDITLKEHFSNELNYLGINEYKIIKENEYKNLANKCEYESILILFSNIYYEFSFINIEILNEEILLTDKENNIIGAVVNKNRNFTASDMLTQLKTFDLPKIQVTEYCKIIENAYDYKSLLTDVLNEKTERRLPEVAQGVFTVSSIPKGDFTLVPPVYLGENIQIESGSVIGPNTVVLNNTLIAENSVAVSSVIMKNSYISDDCYIEKTVMCEDTSLCKNSSVFENSVIGCHSIIGENLFIESNTKVKPYLSVREYASADKSIDKTSLESIENCLSPSDCVTLGKALGTLFLNEKIAILTDGKNGSTVMKFALLSGLLSVGAECIDFGVFFNSSIHYFSKYCEIKYSVYLSTSNGKTCVKIYKNSKPISNGERVIINSILKAKSFILCKENDYKGVRKIKGMQRMYLSFVLMKITENLPFNPKVKCSDLCVNQFINYALNKVKIINSKNNVEFILNNECTRLVVKQDKRTFSYRDIIRAVAFYCQHKNIKDDEIWRYDAVYLMFLIFGILEEYKGNINDLISNTPDYYVADRTLTGKAVVGKFVSEINPSEVSCFSDSIFMKNENSEVIIKKLKGNQLKITVESFNSETAEELAGELADLLNL